MVLEKRLHITTHQGNANQNHMRYYLTPVRIDFIKKTKKKNNTGGDVEKGERLCTVGGNVNWGSHCGKRYRGSSLS